MSGDMDNNKPHALSDDEKKAQELFWSIEPVKAIAEAMKAERTKREEAEAKLTEAHNTIGTMCDDKLALEAKVKELEHSNYCLRANRHDAIRDAQVPLESKLAQANAKIVELEGLLNTAKHLRISPEQKNLDVLQAKIVELEAQNELLANPVYCPVCGSCGEVGCCGKERCLYPDAGLHDANYEIEDLKEKLSTANAKIVELQQSRLVKMKDGLVEVLESELSTANKKAEMLVEFVEYMANYGYSDATAALTMEAQAVLKRLPR